MSRPGVGKLHAPHAVLTVHSPQLRHKCEHACIPHLSCCLHPLLGHTPRLNWRSARPAAAATWFPLQEALLWEVCLTFGHMWNRVDSVRLNMAYSQGSVKETRSQCMSFQQLSAPWKVRTSATKRAPTHSQRVHVSLSMSMIYR